MMEWRNVCRFWGKWLMKERLGIFGHIDGRIILKLVIQKENGRLRAELT
jgi:hypothetical protein